MASNNNNDQMSDYTLGLLLMCVMIAIISKNLDKMEAWAKAHWFSLSLMGIAFIYAVKWFLGWKLKMKHPEIYDRELMIQRMQQKNQSQRRRDEF